MAKYKVKTDSAEGTFEEFEDLMEWLEITDESFDKFEVSIVKETDDMVLLETEKTESDSETVDEG
jgi:hypothetical protein